VIVARDGLAALDFLRDQVREQSALPDVVFLDLQLPKLSGFEVLRRIRADAHTRGLPIVVLTSSREERDIVCCYQLGANSYVRKPIVSEHFTDAIRLAGAYWLRLNERLPAPAARGTNGATVAR
jgi:two-component system response regulator